jgi:hypothetical protein
MSSAQISSRTGRRIARLVFVLVCAILDNTSNQTKHEGYAPAGPAMGSSSTPAYQQEAGHSHHGHGQETYEAPHRSLTEIIKDGANKHEHKAGYAPCWMIP